MNIALIGYGKMGRSIEEIATQKGHTIIIRIDQDNYGEFTRDNLDGTDVAIEFTNPHSAYENIKKCLEFGVPVVSGSTGWTEKLEEAKKICLNNNGAFIYASNFSIGVNIFFEINKRLSTLMKNLPDYHILLEEIHHTQKKDAPSGTAITLAEEILEQITRKKKWVNTLSNNPEELEIISKRIDPAAGTHSVKYSSTVDEIEIIHTAHNRKGFASGAVLAAEFLYGRKGFFTMKDVLNI